MMNRTHRSSSPRAQYGQYMFESEGRFLWGSTLGLRLSLANSQSTSCIFVSVILIFLLQHLHQQVWTTPDTVL